ncbi:hypothetical protein [Niabella drilacis]|uniref:Uncharacterized protein n=1 Tax=Niabella drilacis (strain DSM 25811 / CCM 8410 / CCUG 62505 / LMG 26954 / E90) TaxID=1285928 RepID=A0A1G6RCW3_NIADE|nr:hypothetical protein [Niabella drilacis]SDD02378.1 hypothetical protein SAMN04487894_105235 [Niabella drilacis]
MQVPPYINKEKLMAFVTSAFIIYSILFLGRHAIKDAFTDLFWKLYDLIVKEQPAPGH